MTMAWWNGRSERVCVSCESSVIKVRHWIQNSARTLIANHDGSLTSDRFVLVTPSGARVSSSLWLSSTYMLMMWRDKLGHLAGRPISDVSHFEEGISSPELIALAKPGIFGCCLGDENADAIQRADKKIFTVIFKDNTNLILIAPSEASLRKWLEEWNIAVGLMTSVVEYHMQNVPLSARQLLDLERSRMKSLGKLRTDRSGSEKPGASQPEESSKRPLLLAMEE